MGKLPCGALGKIPRRLGRRHDDDTPHMAQPGTHPPVVSQAECDAGYQRTVKKTLHHRGWARPPHRKDESQDVGPGEHSRVGLDPHGVGGRGCRVGAPLGGGHRRLEVVPVQVDDIHDVTSSAESLDGRLEEGGGELVGSRMGENDERGHYPHSTKSANWTTVGRGVSAVVAAPCDVRDISAGWLGEVLGSRVDDVDIEVIGAGVGFMGQLARVRLVSRDVPASLIVKIPSADPGAQMIGGMMRVWEREHRFYTDIAPNMRSVSIPHCIHSGVDPFVLVLEDLAPARAGDQVEGPTQSQARAVIDAAAALHAEWMNRPELATYDWMPDLNDPSTGMVAQLFPAGWPVFLARYADSLPERVLRWCEAFVPRIVDWVHTYDDWPTTLIHGDFRLDNMFFDDRGGVTLIDWQLAMRAPSTTDLVYFIGTNLPTDTRRVMTEELISRYCDGLRSRGVSAEWADRSRIRKGLTEGVLFYCTSFAASILTLDQANERGAALMDSLVRRAFSAADDLDAGGLLGL